MVLMLRLGRSKFTVAVAAAITIGSATVVFAAEDVEAIFKKGTELRRLGRDAEALTEFQRAGRIQDSPRASAQIALAEQALGLWLDANTHLMKALQRPNDPWIQKNRTALDAALETIQTRLCEVEVWGGPPGAEILIDGKRIGTLPRVSAWLMPGSLPFEAKADGYANFARTLKAPEGGHVREHVDLRPLAAAQAKVSQAEVPAAAAPDPDPTTIVAAPPPPPATESTDAPIYRQWWFWTIIGAGVVAAGGATVWLVTRDGNNSEPCVGTCTRW